MKNKTLCINFSDACIRKNIVFSLILNVKLTREWEFKSQQRHFQCIVGNVKSVSIFHDRWVGLENREVINCSIPEAWQNHTVYKLIDVDTGQCNREVIE